jgi:hypothetical protein
VRFDNGHKQLCRNGFFGRAASAVERDFYFNQRIQYLALGLKHFAAAKDVITRAAALQLFFAAFNNCVTGNEKGRAHNIVL